MTSYKIHSIKDSEKLSFIIEGEDEKSISQKLSSEGHIILSVEKIDIPTQNLFCFEGKKQDGSFLEGKISADDIFLAYGILKNEYKYIITKLYPETVTEKEKQEKIFQDLLQTFQEKDIKKPKILTDTSKLALEKYKKLLAQLIIILQEKEPNEEGLIADLKKLEQNNNVTLIQEELKNTLKNLLKKRENKSLFEQIRPLLKEMQIFVLPDILFTFLGKIFSVVKFLDPLFHPREVHIQRRVSVENISDEAAQKEYESVQNNTNIHTFLRKKYRTKFANIFSQNTKKYYIYTLLREKKTIMSARKTLKNIQKIIHTALLVTVCMVCLLFIVSPHNTVFITMNVLIVFGVLLAGSLVIQSETV